MAQTKRFWLGLVLTILLFLGAGAFYWGTRGEGFQLLAKLLGFLPVSTEMRDDLSTVASLAEAIFNTNGEERTFLILFQNNMELRPGGGFIGSFGILKVRDGHVTDFQSHDVINFDGRIPDTTPAPYPMYETLRVKYLKLRDSNFSPDWKVNALAAEKFYREGEGQEKFDGIVGITTDVLSSFLKVTGPVEVPGYPGTYDAETGVVNLEYQVEQGFLKQNITRGDRKDVMDLLGHIILDKVKALSLTKKYELFKVILDDLHKKDVQIYLKDETLQSAVSRAGWDGKVDQAWKSDALMTVDSNMSALKSDYHIKRSLKYVIDLRPSAPAATASITYVHTAKEKDFMTRDYQSYLRLYVPDGSWLESVEGNTTEPVFGTELGRKYFGTIIQVPLGTTKTITFHYKLREGFLEGAPYDLKIEKQAGVNDMPVVVTVIQKDGSKRESKTVLNRPFVLSDAK